MYRSLVSVILPTYNRAYILKRAINSIMRQSYKNFELIVVDDCSSDNTREVIDSYKSSRIKYILNKENLGGAESRNIGIRQAKGKFIAFQDSDDEWFSKKLEKQIGILDKSGDKVGAIYCNLEREGDQKNTIYSPEKIMGNIHEELLKANFITLPSLVVKKTYLEKVGLFDPKLPRLQDWDLLLRLSKQCQILYTDEVLLKTYFSKDSITAKNEAYTKALKMILDKYRYEFVQKRLYSAHLLNLANNLSYEKDSGMRITYFLFQAWKYDLYNLKYGLVFFVSLFGRRIYNVFLRNYKTFLLK